MSTTYFLVCHETKTSVQIGQGYGFSSLWFRDEQAMAALHSFLRDNMGEMMETLSEHDFEDLDEEYHDYYIDGIPPQ